MSTHIDTGDDRLLFVFAFGSSVVLALPNAVPSILFSLISSNLLLFNNLLVDRLPLPLQSDMVGEASDGVARQPFCAVALFAEFDADRFVDDNCSLSVFTSFSANVALCNVKKKKSNEIEALINVFIGYGYAT